MDRVVIQLVHAGQAALYINCLVPRNWTDETAQQWVATNIEYVRWAAKFAPTPSFLVLPYGRIARA